MGYRLWVSSEIKKPFCLYNGYDKRGEAPNWELVRLLGF